MSEPASAGRRILVLAPVGKDSQLLCAMLDHVGIPSHCCKHIRTLCALIEEGADAVLISDEALTGADVSLLVASIAAQRPWSDLPVMILTAYGESSPTVTRAMETLGNVALLERPLQRSTLLSAVRAARRASARQHQARRWRVLVVDDNRDSAESIARLLELVGSQVHCEHDGLSAVTAAARLSPDLILLDIGLPDIDGSRRPHASVPSLAAAPVASSP